MTQAGASMNNLTGVEDGLAAMLTDAANRVAHAEYFDDEQRAEVYAILEALKANSQTHRDMVKKLARIIKERPADA